MPSIDEVLAVRPIDHERLHAAVVDFTRDRRQQMPPDELVQTLRHEFACLVRSGYIGALTLRSQAVSWAVQEYLRGRRE